MNIAIIGSGNVGGTLAAKWAKAGHRIFIGARDHLSFKGKHLLENPNTSVHPIAEAVQASEIILIAVPAPMAVETTRLLGDTSGKIIIDAMNVVMGRGPQGFSNTADAILSVTPAAHLVKCFNTTGYNNMEDPVYNGQAIDAFMAGENKSAKEKVRQLALDAGFAECYDIGGKDKFELMEKFAFFWINLAMMQGQGRNIAFKLIKRE